MSLVARLITILPRVLYHYLPNFLVLNTVNYNQDLLSAAEVLDLRLRISSPLLRPKNQFDTASQQTGDSRSVHRGYGCDYEESRLYQAGDESRYIIWPLSARTSQLYMKVFREERRPGVFILLDRRVSMQFGTRIRLKVQQAARAAVCVALNANRNHASLGAVILNQEFSKPQWIQDSGVQHNSEEFIRAASGACVPQTHHGEFTDGTLFTFSKVLDMLNASLIQGTSIYLISDFMDVDKQHRAQLMQLGSKHKIKALHIFDPSEQQLSDVGKAQFQVSNQHENFTVDTHNTNVKSAFKNAVQNHFRAREQLFTSLNIEYKAISTTHEAIENILG